MRQFSPSLLLVVLMGCTTQDVVEPSGNARFPEYPTDLIAAFKAACAEPSQTFLQPTREVVECREFLPPEPTAAIILSFDGTPADLPQLVIRFRTRQDAPGYLVESDVFLNIPQQSGEPLELRQEDPALGRTLANLYKRSGGSPE